MYRLHRTSYLCHPIMSRLNWAIHRSSLATYPSCHLDIVTSKRSDGEATSHFSSHFPADVHFRRFIQCERSHLSNKHSFWEYDEFTSVLLDFPHKFATHMQVHYLSYPTWLTHKEWQILRKTISTVYLLIELTNLFVKLSYLNSPNII